MNTEPTPAFSEQKFVQAIAKPAEPRPGWIKRFQEKNLQRRAEIVQGAEFSMFVYLVWRLWWNSKQVAMEAANYPSGDEWAASVLGFVFSPVPLLLRPVLFCFSRINKVSSMAFCKVLYGKWEV